MLKFLDCYLHEKTTRPNEIVLSYDVQFIDLFRNETGEVFTACFSRRGSIRISVNKSNWHKCVASVGEGLEDTETLFNRGMGTYLFKAINIKFNNEPPNGAENGAEFKKRLNVVSSNDETILKAQNVSLKLTALTFLYSIFVLFVIEMYRILRDDKKKPFVLQIVVTKDEKR